jgi:hypothetical protein
MVRGHGADDVRQLVVSGAVAPWDRPAALAGLGAVAQAGERSGLPWIILSTAVASLGNGVVLPALIGTALVTVPRQQAGTGVGVLTTAQQFAGSAGVAVIGTVFFAIVGHAGPATGRYPAAMTVAACTGAALAAAVAALTAWTARHASRPEHR